MSTSSLPPSLLRESIKILPNVSSKGFTVPSVAHFSAARYGSWWKATVEHPFPIGLCHRFDNHAGSMNEWEGLRKKDPQALRKYLTKIAIETNHLGSTFRITSPVSFFPPP